MSDFRKLNSISCNAHKYLSIFQFDGLQTDFNISCNFLTKMNYSYLLQYKYSLNLSKNENLPQ